MIDLGSIAKGYIGDKILDIMENHGLKKGLVNMREDMVIFGEITLDVHIQHPRDKEKVIHSFKIKNSAVATSGDYAQYSKSFDESHILGKKDIISSTVVADNLMEADACATVLMLLDSKERKEFLRKFKHLKTVLITSSLSKEINNL